MSALTRWTMGLLLVSLMGSTMAGELPTRKGWDVVFADTFQGPAGQLPDATKWQVDTGHSYPNGPANWGTQEIQAYTADPANLSLDGQGHLAITPRRDAQGQWTSGRIETTKAFTPPPGHVLRIEARIQMPKVMGEAALGYWPAFWALGESFRATKAWSWPQAGEFDIMENVNGLDSVWGILHCGVYPAGPCGEPNGIGSRSPCPNTTCPGEFHTYVLEWDRTVRPETIQWFVDDQPANRVSQNQLPAETWKQLTDQEGYFLLLNVAMGGGFSYIMAGSRPTPTEATEPGHPMLVDYVGVWTRASMVELTAQTTPISASITP